MISFDSCRIMYQPPLHIGSEVELCIGGIIIDGRVSDRPNGSEIKVELTLDTELAAAGDEVETFALYG